jgi:cellulose synthase/poly-beta-1,6-N-acetylglucosamine synthase-like glycosyltransferase
MARYSATLVISIYRDIPKLRCILEALRWQSARDFEVLVSEDGRCEKVAAFLHPHLDRHPNLRHLTQDDLGFRKNRALNRAVCLARSDYLIFIDGDCVPHTRFIEMHLSQSDARAVCAGRRVELGPRFSRRLIEEPASLRAFQNPWLYLLLAPSLHRDAIKNYEVGFALPLLQRITRKRPLHIVGCNFSCSRKALEEVNGFDEKFEGPGIGEDSDLEWRLAAAGYRVKNIKFSAPVYHLHHERSSMTSNRNHQLMVATQAQNLWRCQRGLDQAST